MSEVVRAGATSHACAHEADIGILNTAIVEIKDTLRNLTDLLTSNAVLEEQAVTTRNRIKELDNRVRELEINSALAKGRNIFTERVVWSLVCAALAGWKFIGG